MLRQVLLRSKYKVPVSSALDAIKSSATDLSLLNLLPTLASESEAAVPQAERIQQKLIIIKGHSRTTPFRLFTLSIVNSIWKKMSFDT